MNGNHQQLVFENKDFQLIVSPNKKHGLSSSTWHEELEIKYYLSGEQAVMIDSKAVDARAGNIVIVNPYQLHSTVESEDIGCEYHLLMIGMDFFSSRNLDRFDTKHLLQGGRVRFNNLITDNPRAGHIICTIVKEVAEKKPSYELAVRGLMLELFALLLRNEVSEVLPEDIRSDNAKYYSSIEPAILKIRSCYAQKLTLDELADSCKISKHHFCRIFKRATGVTPVEFITEYRLVIADMLLRNSEDSIADIAHQSGFEDESYFSRCYKKHRGCSPQRARARLSK